MNTSTTQQQTYLALWTPGWYELDQSLEVNVTSRFWFFQSAPSDYPEVERYDFVFFNQLASGSNMQVREATIVSMIHPQLGQIKKIDAGGLDYIFFRLAAPEVVVNAEEDPGTIYDAPIIITDWSVAVELANVSEPISNVA
ncbi:MAG TPA: hypothetical protein PKD64_00500 [Pirellulaceae bacterium]|nr:hypothetical protein [Pirellulaceae bacterium]HMO90649.1 hypothetical protein [Pirellulaceae bacterium]HMP67772.1 hypothetical protein [Pirellulaceae bacterium]